MEFHNSTRSFFIKASLLSEFSCLSFPRKFNRSRKNSVDLFPESVLKKVVRVQQYKNERCFSIDLEGDAAILFKLHGNRGNVIFIRNRIVTEIFKNSQTADFNLDLGALDRDIDFSKASFLLNQDKLEQTYFTFGKEVWDHLRENGFDLADADTKWILLNKTLSRLEAPGFYLLNKGGALTFSLLADTNGVDLGKDPIAALDTFFQQRSVNHAFLTEKNRMISRLQEQIGRTQAYLAKSSKKVDELREDTHFKLWGDLVMTSLSSLKQGDTVVRLPDFHHENKPVEIKLNKNLTPQKNAEVFYRKHKNRTLEIQKVASAIESKTLEIEALQRTLAEIESVADLRELRGAHIDKPGNRPGASQKTESLPYHEFEHRGFRIWVGKNAESNDKLTLKYSFKEDLWLHARDVPGSHVLIKYQAGKTFPKDVIERAAGLAAFYSKRKTDSLCPVSCTPKKFVRKRKGDPPGAVIVEKEKVILVEPKK